MAVSPPQPLCRPAARLSTSQEPCSGPCRAISRSLLPIAMRTLHNGSRIHRVRGSGCLHPYDPTGDVNFGAL
jgi:hypothetical protein